MNSVNTSFLADSDVEQANSLISELASDYNLRFRKLDNLFFKTGKNEVNYNDYFRRNNIKITHHNNFYTVTQQPKEALVKRAQSAPDGRKYNFRPTSAYIYAQKAKELILYDKYARVTRASYYIISQNRSTSAPTKRGKTLNKYEFLFDSFRQYARQLYYSNIFDNSYRIKKRIYNIAVNSNPIYLYLQPYSAADNTTLHGYKGEYQKEVSDPVSEFLSFSLKAKKQPITGSVISSYDPYIVHISRQPAPQPAEVSLAMRSLQNYLAYRKSTIFRGK